MTTLSARARQKGKRLVARKSPKTEKVLGKGKTKAVSDPNKIEYDPIPKYHGTLAKDQRKKAVGLTVLSEWRNNFDYNPNDFTPSQFNFKQAYKEIKKELGFPTR